MLNFMLNFRKKTLKTPSSAITLLASTSARPASLRINKFNVVRQDDPSHPKDVIAAEGNKHTKHFIYDTKQNE